jgi:hypothetical protein
MVVAVLEVRQSGRAAERQSGRTKVDCKSEGFSQRKGLR